MMPRTVGTHLVYGGFEQLCHGKVDHQRCSGTSHYRGSLYRRLPHSIGFGRTKCLANPEYQ